MASAPAIARLHKTLRITPAMARGLPITFGA